MIWRLSFYTDGNNQSTFPRIDPRLDVDMSGPAWERKIFSTKYLELFLCETILNTHIFTKFMWNQFTHKETGSYSTKSARSLFLWCDQSLFFHDDKGGKQQHVWKHAEKKKTESFCPGEVVTPAVVCPCAQIVSKATTIGTTRVISQRILEAWAQFILDKRTFEFPLPQEKVLWWYEKIKSGQTCSFPILNTCVWVRGNSCKSIARICSVLFSLNHSRQMILVYSCTKLLYIDWYAPNLLFV